jgi:flagellar biosynthesis/type III secretory pathway protein FliH
MPMVDDPVILGVKGQAPFADAALRLAAAVADRKIILKGPSESWFAHAVQPLVDSIKAQQIETAQPADEANRPEGLDAAEGVTEESYEEEINRVYLAGYTKGYENGFGVGFERGVDTGFKLSPSKK